MSTNHIDRGQDGIDRKELRAKVDQLNKAAFENWHNPTWRNEMAQELTESIYWGFEHENLLNQIANVENAPFDGRVFVKETRGLRAFWVARGGYIEASTLHAEVMEIPRDTIGFHVNEFEDKLQTNFAETQATLQDLGVQRLDAEVNNRLLRLFQAAIPSSSPYYVSTAGINLTSLNHALRAVRDATLDVGGVSIIGRATMTDQIIDAITTTNSYGGFLPQTNEDLFKSGVLGSYRGANIVTLTNYKDGDDVPFFPANEMYIVARDASKFAFWGGLQSKEWDEQDNWYWHFLARRDFGGVVHRPERLRRIVDTNTAP